MTTYISSYVSDRYADHGIEIDTLLWVYEEWLALKGYETAVEACPFVEGEYILTADPHDLVIEFQEDMDISLEGVLGDAYKRLIRHAIDIGPMRVLDDEENEFLYNFVLLSAQLKKEGYGRNADPTLRICTLCAGCLPPGEECQVCGRVNDRPCRC